jgi:tetratricopeptide (TPR) repeat protein
MTAPAGIESTGYGAKPLAPPDVRAVLADVHLHSPDYQEKAIGEFEEVLKLQPDHPAALRGLGYAYLMKQDYHHAGEYFRKAVEHDSDDPRVLYYSALMIQQEEGPGLGNDREELAVIQKQLEKSVALDPGFADSYSLLAFTYLSLGELDKALPTMLKAIGLNPRNEGYSLNLARIYLVHHKFDAAIALLEQLSKSTDPALAAEAAQALSTAQNAKLAEAAGVPVNIRAGPAPGAEGTRATKSSAATATEAATPESAPDLGPARFLKGRLIGVDCSSPLAAMLTVTSGANTWKLHARDRTRVIVIGADKFSCDWTNQRVAVNYHQTGERDGEVISVEVQ